MAELAEEGYKFSESSGFVYIGDNRWPTYKFALNLIHLLGGKYEVVGIEKLNWKKEIHVKISDGLGNILSVPSVLIKNKNKIKTPKTVTLKLKDNYDEAEFSGLGFRFPCGWKNISKNEARKVATWILRVSK